MHKVVSIESSRRKDKLYIKKLCQSIVNRILGVKNCGNLFRVEVDVEGCLIHGKRVDTENSDLLDALNKIKDKCVNENVVFQVGICSTVEIIRNKNLIGQLIQYLN